MTLDPFLIYSVTLYEHFFRFSLSFLTSPRRTFFFLSTPSSFCSHSHLVISFSMSVVIKSVETKKVEPKGSLGHYYIPTLPLPCFCLVGTYIGFLVPLWPKYESKWWLSEYLGPIWLSTWKDRSIQLSIYSTPLRQVKSFIKNNSTEATYCSNHPFEIYLLHKRYIVYEKNVHKILSHKALSPSLKPVKSEYRSKWRQFSSPLTLRGKKEEEDNFWFAGKLLLLGPWTSHVLPVLDTKCSNTNSLNRKKKKD